MHHPHPTGQYKLRALLLAACFVPAFLPLPVLAQAETPRAVAAAAAAPAATSVPVRAVSLYSSGVGYFEHSGSVTGSSQLSLTFKPDQINDVLKSLLLQDLDGGRVSTVSYPSQDPLSRRLGSFALDVSQNITLPSLAAQLRGQSVTVTLADRTLSGTVAGVENVKRPVGDAILEEPSLILVTPTGLQSVPFSQARAMDIDDPRLKAELAQALTLLASAKDQNKKSVAISFDGQGDRRVRMGYVVQTPVWKTSYRLTMGANDAKKIEGGKEGGGLQGWAIVENQTDSDWTNIQLSLISGRPISFVQNLYSPLYVNRPTVEIERFANLRPREYEEGGARQNFSGLAPASPAAAPMPGLESRDRNFRRVSAATKAGEGGSIAESVADSVAMYAQSDLQQPLDPLASVSSSASGSRIGELFQYTVQNVSVPRQSSAMIPIVTSSIDLTPVSIFNAAILARHPLSGARLTNTTGSHLLAGPVTVINNSAYAGDALLDDVPPGQTRLLSFGVDLETLVDITPVRTDASITSGKLVKGVLEIKRKTASETRYDVTNKTPLAADAKANAPKTIIIEHPLRPGWTLTSAKPTESTDRFHRFEVASTPGKPAALTITEETTNSEFYALADTDPGFIATFITSNSLSPEVRAALETASALQRDVANLQQQINTIDQSIAEITQEQQRIRENMRTVDRTTDYHQRLLKKLNEQETQIESARTAKDKLQDSLKAKQAELADYLQNLSIG